MKNTNCLDGIRCPRCKQSDAFYIVASVASHEVRVTDDGTDDKGVEWEWNNDSQCRCADDCCGFSGELREFQVKNQPRDPLNDEEYDSNDDQIEDLKALIHALKAAGRGVVDAWEGGDLAGAVRILDALITAAKEQSTVRTRKHTPGPWTYEYNPYTAQDGHEIPAYQVHGAEKVFDTNEDRPAEEQEANARLGAAAPELRDSLEYFYQFAVLNDDGEDERFSAKLAEARAVLETTGWKE